jgi:hypothetical protein
LTNFYFTFGQGTGQEGTIAKVYAYDTVNNTVTLDLYTPYTKITAGGDIGIHAGFYNLKVSHNYVQGAVGTSNTYATAFSLYLDVFNSEISYNTATGCAHGLNLAGGLMLATYQTLAWNNTVAYNNFYNCDQLSDTNPDEDSGVIRVLSYYGGGMQYGNRFLYNNINGGRVFIEKQGNFIWEGNTTKNTKILFVP